MLRARLTLATGGLAFVLTTGAILSGGQQDDDAMQDPIQRAIYILGNERWYENIDVWTTRGASQSEPPKLAPSAIRGRELSELLALIALMSDDEELSKYLQEYVKHRNKDVARLALREVVRRGEWTKENAHQFAREAGLPVEDYIFPTPEEHWERLRATQREPSDAEKAAKLQVAVRILEDPRWHERDPGIAKLRANNERNPPEKRSPIDGHIRIREVSAIDTLINLDLARERKEEFLTKYLQHHNDGVPNRCFAALVRLAMWQPERAVEYTQQNNPTVGGWSFLLNVLPKDAPQKVRTMIARQVLTASRNEEPKYLPGSPPGGEIAAVRVLLRAGEERDHASIQWAVRQYPDSPLLWAAASRLPKDEETKRLAREIYTDVTKPVPVRCAAALVFVQNDPTIMLDVGEHILNAVREFGTREFMQWTHEGWSNPADPSRVKPYLKAKEAEGFLPVAYEMPDEFWRKHMNEIIRYPYGILGGCMCEILARKLPHEFVETVATLDSIPEELHGALVSAERWHVDAKKKIKELVPLDRYVSLSKIAEEFGTAAPAITSMTLWE